MAKIPCRRFTLADIMILVGFTAGGLALARPVLEAQNRNPWWLTCAMSYGSCVLGSWTIAHLLFRLRRPRPSLRRSFRQPGAAASVVSLVSIFVWILCFVVAGILGQWSNAWSFLAYPALTIGPAILGIWILNTITRSFRAEKGWIDRVGIAVGIGWCLLMFVVFYWVMS